MFEVTEKTHAEMHADICKLHIRRKEKKKHRKKGYETRIIEMSFRLVLKEEPVALRVGHFTVTSASLRVGGLVWPFWF